MELINEFLFPFIGCGNDCYLEQIQIHQTNGQDRILNNSVINSFPIRSPIDQNTQTKRSYKSLAYVQFVCTTVIGDEDPVWLSDNALIIDSTGEVVNNDTLGINVYQTPHTTELIFSSFYAASYAGTYTCQSRQSSISLNFFIAAGKLAFYITASDEHNGQSQQKIHISNSKAHQ